MKQIYPDLWQTRIEHPFPGLSTHAYLFVREGGNVLFYGTGHEDEYPRIRERGGVARQYLSHRDEAGPALARIREEFGAMLCCHRLEAPFARAHAPVDLVFDSRGTHLDTVEVIPTPGHTDGSTCFFVRPPHGRTYLFTGDTIFLSDGGWGTYPMPRAGGSADDLRASLALLRDLAPDVVISSASVGGVAFKEMTPGEWQQAVDEAAAALA